MQEDFFLDAHQNEEFALQGFIHIPSFIDKNEQNTLLKLYKKREQSFFNKGFHRTLDLLNETKKRTIIQNISAVITPKSEIYLKNYRILLASFMTKEKGADVFDIHQNWTFVDETQFTSLVIWIPLQDVNEENGCLHFIPGSNQWEKGIRGNNIAWQYEPIKSELLSKMVALPMKAGDAAIFNDATIHFTSANKTKRPRISIAQVMIPKAATPIFYNKNLQNNKIEKYEISDDFYLNFRNKYLKGDLTDLKLVSN
jgi:ectoine hydroxylase-related dioxygenase (phytanoyl-CoA dioxygenase family)